MLVKKRRGLSRGGDQDRTCLDKSKIVRRSCLLRNGGVWQGEETRTGRV
jgi:hypothetical protein